MRIATYNVNSIRSRVGRILDWMVREDVDVVAMQEIKCTEAQFPFEQFEAAGYEVVLHGLNQWNGVAIASRQPIQDVEVGFDGMPGFAKGLEGPDQPLEARAIGATVGGIRIWSLYVPNGRALGRSALRLQARLARRARGRRPQSGWRRIPTSRSR